MFKSSGTVITGLIVSFAKPNCNETSEIVSVVSILNVSSVNAPVNLAYTVYSVTSFVKFTVLVASPKLIVTVESALTLALKLTFARQNVSNDLSISPLETFV